MTARWRWRGSMRHSGDHSRLTHRVTEPSLKLRINFTSSPSLVRGPYTCVMSQQGQVCSDGDEFADGDDYADEFEDDFEDDNVGRPRISPIRPPSISSCA